jgi:hypothetical protein
MVSSAIEQKLSLRQLESHFPAHVQGAGKGNRTLIASLEGWSFTIKLCPRAPKLPRPSGLAKFFCAPGAVRELAIGSEPG